MVVRYSEHRTETLLLNQVILVAIVFFVVIKSNGDFDDSPVYSPLIFTTL